MQKASRSLSLSLSLFIHLSIDAFCHRSKQHQEAINYKSIPTYVPLISLPDKKMAPNALLILTLVLATACHAMASDPDITTDFVVPGGAVADSAFFTFTGLRSAVQGGAGATPPASVPFKVTKASQVEFPALAGQSVSMAVLQYAPNGINPLHTHPRSAELLLLVQGWLEVGFVDSTNKLFVQTLKAGDMFVFPKGLPHYQLNRDVRYPAVAVSAFGSANAGTVVLPKALFGTGIGKDVLAKSFKTDVATIEKLVAAAAMG